MTRDVERYVDERDEHVANCQVRYEHIGDAVQTTMTANHMTDERVREQRDTEDEQIGST